MMGLPEPDYGFEQAVAPDDFDRIAEVTHVTQKAKLLWDSLGVCFFAFLGIPGILPLISKALDAATGVKIAPENLLVVGHRIITLQRLINVYLGYQPEDDFDMANRMFEKIATGPAAGSGLTRGEFTRIRDKFYAYQGWSLENGAPSEQTLARLGLSDLEIGTAA
jgi:aldehyde:ferredoxin oxidoreductase